MALKKSTNIKALPLRGGCVTVREPELLPSRSFSMLQNVRGKHPGFQKRKGCIKQHSTADGTNQVLSLYQFKKTAIAEEHVFAQMSDGDILEATTAPPGVTTGAFGSEVNSGSASQIPASWGNISDMLIHSNGVDQHQIYTGTDNYVRKFVKYDHVSAAPPNVPADGFDYTEQVIDGKTTTSATLNSLDTLAAFECVFICTPVPMDRLTLTMSAINGTASYGTLSYRQDDATWEALTYAAHGWSDGTEALTLDVAAGTAWEVGDTIEGLTSGVTCTIVSITSTTLFQISGRTGAFTLNEILTNGTYTADQGAANPTVGTLGYTGSMTWTTQPTDQIPSYMYGVNGFWYQLKVSVQLDLTVKVSKATFGSGFQDVQNIWDGVLQYAIEAKFYDDSASTYTTSGSSAIEIDDMTASDKVYFNSADPIDGFYVDVGDTPNSTTQAIDAVYCWDGDSWVSLGTITDGTGGLVNSGWVTFARNANQHPTQFQTSQYYSYWYFFEVAGTIGDDVIIGIQTAPYFDIEEMGKGQCNAVWKGRAVYSFTRYPEYIYISSKAQPLTLNGNDFGVLEIGDGRSNKITAMKKFHNELLVWQEETGVEGGTLTLVEGYSPATYGKLMLSSRAGTFSAKSAVVVDGVMTSQETDAKAVRHSTMAYFLSRSGVYVTNGMAVWGISDDIQNYFEPRESECIRRGYEKEHWIEYDSAENVLRLGLVSGASATVPNIFPVYDLTDQVWTFDSLAQELSCMAEVEAASGNVPVVQIGGGVDDGFVYVLNNSNQDVSTAITSYIQMELSEDGEYVHLGDMVFQTVAAASVDYTLTISKNSVAAVSSKNLDADAENTNELIRRHREHFNQYDQLITIKIQNNQNSEAHWQALGLETKVWEPR